MRYGLIEFFGISDAHTSSYIQQYARAAERCGFDSIWCPEHVVMFRTYKSPYPYTADGEFHYGPDSGIFGLLDPLHVCQTITEATSELRAGTHVLVVPQRQPVLLAKHVATVDHLSGGRLDLGVGIGWAKEEYDALGAPFNRKGVRMDEFLDAMTRLWSDQESTYDGEFVRFSGAILHPRPAQRPHTPIFIGGHSKAALDRVARIGSGWSPWNPDQSAMPSLVDDLAGRLAARGRSLDEVFIQVALELPDASEASLDFARSYGEAVAPLGVQRIVFNPGIFGGPFAERLSSIAETLEIKQATA